MTNFQVNFNKVIHFIENISSIKERDFFSAYINLYNGNKTQYFEMIKLLDRLKEYFNDKDTIHLVKPSYSEFYQIQNKALMEYFFYYYNHIFYYGFRNANDFFKPYIEAILCRNSIRVQEFTCFGNHKFINEKYSLNYIDFDILSKFISTKDLIELIQDYEVKKLKVDETKNLFLVNCFRNLCHSLINSKTYGFQKSSFSILSNLSLLLSLVELNDKCKKDISSSIKNLLLDSNIVEIIFSVHCPDFKYCLLAFSKLCSILPLPTNTQIIRKIISNKNFFDYAKRVNLNTLRNFFTNFLHIEDLIDKQSEIQAIIDITDDFSQKVIILRLIYKYIIDVRIKDSYCNLLLTNFINLDTHAIYDFVLNNWLKPSREVINAYLREVIELQAQQPKGVYSFPNPVETRLECIYILYIAEIITDISILKELADKRPHLQFLLNSDNFDYTQVDFSNYMWVNFARHSKYMEKFIAHRDDIIPKIQDRLKISKASEDEKKILYSYLLNGDEVWKV